MMTTFTSGARERSRYGYALLALIGAMSLELLVQRPAGMQFPGLLYTAIVAIAWYAGAGPALLAIVAGSLATWWLRRHAPANESQAAWETLVVFAVAAGTSGVLALGLRHLRGRQRALMERATRAEHETAEAKRAAEALSQHLSAQAEWHATTLRSIGAAVITADASDRVLAMNPLAESLTGWCAADAHGAPVARVFAVVGADGNPQCTPSAVQSMVRAAELGEALLQARDGSARFVRFTSAPIQRDDGGRAGRVLTFSDVSGQREVEALQQQLARAAQHAEQSARSALVESQAASERFSAFMTHFPYPAFIQDERGEFVFLNAAGNASAAWREVATRPHDTGPSVMSEAVTIAGNDRHYFSIRFPIVAQGRAWLGGIAIDMTERVRAQRELSERTAELETLFRCVPAPLWIARDTAAAEIVGNPAANALLGADECTVDIRACRFFRGGEPCGADELPIALCMRERRTVQGMDMELERPDGTRRSVRMTAAPLLDASGRVRGAVAAALDISQLKDYEAELEQAVRRRDEFLAVLAHELRNPLVPIDNAAQIIKRVPGDVERVRRAASAIDRQIARIVRLIGDLLDVARISQGLIAFDLKPRSLASILDSAIQTVADVTNETSHEIAIEARDPSAEVLVDALRAEQIVVNVLSNAVKYSPAGTPIRVRIEADESFGRIVVTDQGRGIAKEHLPEIFRMFARPGLDATQRTNGLGVGLALAKQLVEQQGGTIEAASDGPGHGATFVIAFPRAPRASVAQRAA
jgi:PAS domain S-box-containing protein